MNIIISEAQIQAYKLYIIIIILLLAQFQSEQFKDSILIIITSNWSNMASVNEQLPRSRNISCLLLPALSPGLWEYAYLHAVNFTCTYLYTPTYLSNLLKVCMYLLWIHDDSENTDGNFHHYEYLYLAGECWNNLINIHLLKIRVPR